MYQGKIIDRTTYTNNLHPFSDGARFNVICERCDTKFTVIRNFGGGLRLASNENINPAVCPNCGSRTFEVW